MAASGKQQGVRDIKRTLLAQQGVDFATLFTAKFISFELRGYSAKLREPSGVSTEGGKQAMQHIVLDPAEGGDALVVTAGQVNVVSKQVRLRTYECLVEMHTRRYKDRPFPIDRAQYQAFFEAVKTFLHAKQMQVEIETRPPDVGPSSTTDLATPGQGGLPPRNILIAVGVVVALVIVFLLMRR